MKVIKCQNKLSLVNAQHIHHISAEDELDEDGEETGNMEICVHFDADEDAFSHTMATYRTTDECIRNLDKLASFLSSSISTGLHEMS